MPNSDSENEQPEENASQQSKEYKNLASKNNTMHNK